MFDGAGSPLLCSSPGLLLFHSALGFFLWGLLVSHHRLQAHRLQQLGRAVSDLSSRGSGVLELAGLGGCGAGT